MKKQSTLEQQIERARTIVNGWPPEKLAKMQLQGTDIYLERTRAVQPMMVRSRSARIRESA